MSTRELRCPNCSADVEFESPGAVVVVCTHCNWASYRTDVDLETIGEVAQPVLLASHFQIGTAGRCRERSFTVRAQQVYGIGDVLGQLFGQTSTAGSIEVVSGANLIADARTYNLVATGTYGQYIPARGWNDAIADGVGYLCMTSQSATARTNLGLTNLDDRPAEVEVRLFDRNGNQMNSAKTYTVRAHGTTQINRVVEEFTGLDLEAARLEIRVAAATPNGLILAFGSVVDEQTGDPVFEAATVVE